MPQFTYRDSAARKPFEEPGEYHVTVESFEFSYANSGNELLTLKLRTDSGALVYDNLVFTDAAFWKIDHALKCFLPSRGLKPPGKNESFDLNNDYAQTNLLGAQGWVLLSKTVTPAGKTRNEVDSYLPPKKGGQPVPGTTTKATTPTPATSATSATTKPAGSTDSDDDEIPF